MANSVVNNGGKLYYEKSSHHASYNFNQSAQSLFRNQPRFPFEYYININLNNVGTANAFISGFFNSPDLAQMMPLVKTVDMPAFKIETTPLNQYNRKRLSQTKIAFEPVKIVFHDVADGKTLKFWDMYYRYYFADGNEPGKNQSKESAQQFGGTYYTEPAGAASGQSTSAFAAKDPRRLDLGSGSSTNTNGDKSAIQNIVSDTLDNHNFGFNLPTVENIRNLIQSIDIYQVHGGRFNQVTLVNPRISAFTHDVLNYASSDKTLEMTFVFEYEYAYYTIQNMKLGAGEANNSSSMEQFEHGDYLELQSLSFTKSDPAFIESNNPALQNNSSQSIGNNIQASLSAVKSQYITETPPVRTSSSSLGGIVDISPSPANIPSTPNIQTRPFEFSPTISSTSPARGDTGAEYSGDARYTYYPDMNRASGA